MEKFGRKVVQLRIPILILSLVLLIPSFLGYVSTRVNYDILSYLPKDIETMVGQDILVDEFGTGAFSMFVVEGMEPKEIAGQTESTTKTMHTQTIIGLEEESLELCFIKILSKADIRLSPASLTSSLPLSSAFFHGQSRFSF